VLLSLALAGGAEAAFDVSLEGQSANSTAWVGNNLRGWRELDYIPMRLAIKGGPAQNQTLLVDFERFNAGIPGIENLSQLRFSPNVVVVAGPTLSAPVGQDTWTYALTIHVTDNKAASIEFLGRLSAGAHLNVGSSLHLRGVPTSMSTLQIHKPGPAVGAPDLLVVKQGPPKAAPGAVIAYTLSYSNRPTYASKATGAQLTDVLPPGLSVETNSLAPGTLVVGNTIVWDLGSIEPSGRGVVSFQARVHPAATNGQVLENLAMIYSAENDADLSNNVSRAFTLVGVNRPPVAAPDGYTVDEDTVLTVSVPGLLANDLDADGDRLSAVLVSSPAHGTLAFNADGSFVYRPATNYFGPDSFTYKANDGTADSAVVTVSLTVNPVNDPPVAAPDGYVVFEDLARTVAAPGLLGNDSDVDGDTLRAVLVTGPAHGGLTLNADGSFRYAPEPDYNGPDSFTYKAHDGTVDSAVVTVSLTVQPVNDAPSFVRGGDVRVAFNAAPRRLGVWATSIRPGPANESDQAVLFLMSNNNPALFAAQPALSPDGALSFTPAPDAWGHAVVTAVLRDNGGVANGGVDTSAPQSFVLSVNAPPTVAIVNPPNGAVFIAPASIPIVAEASDPDGRVTSVEFLAGTNRLAQVVTAPYSTLWTNVGPGTYTLLAKATDDDEESRLSAPVTITVVEGPTLLTGAMRFNPQSGLFEQPVRIQNPSLSTLPAVRILVSNLPPRVQVWNASGTTNGLYFVQYDSTLAPDQSADLTLEYYDPLRLTPSPVLRAEVAAPLPAVQPAGGAGVRINRQLWLADGTFLIEFDSLTNRSYCVQYTTDLKQWKTALPAVAGTGTRTQWIDNGPPRTETAPSRETCRMYRVIQMP
jgi:uncharacterized repeat protein (TIGR01451 family)